MLPRRCVGPWGKAEHWSTEGAVPVAITTSCVREIPFGHETDGVEDTAQSYPDAGGEGAGLTARRVTLSYSSSGHRLWLSS